MNEVIKKDSSPEESNKIIPQETSIVNEYDIDAFLEKRKEFIEKVNAIMVKGSDYHEIQGRKSLAKGGAEKIASIFGWSATFGRDSDTMEAFRIEGLIAFVCDLYKSNRIVGQGRGAATLSKNSSDPNKTIKMAQKSAFIDAVLRASGLSDFFTQDLEDMNGHEVQAKPSREATRPNLSIKPATQAQMNFINNLMTAKNYTVKDLLEAGFDKDQSTSAVASKIIEFLKEAPQRSNYKHPRYSI